MFTERQKKVIQIVVPITKVYEKTFRLSSCSLLRYSLTSSPGHLDSLILSKFL